MKTENFPENLPKSILTFYFYIYQKFMDGDIHV